MPDSEQPIISALEKNYMPYVMSVIVSRAIPEIDGFKPSHRKLLYTMHKMGLQNGARTKSANVVGQTMKLNPHGESDIYETMVRLTRGNAALLHPYIDSKGNFGKQFSRDKQCAASRYTEVKLDKITEEVFGGIDEDTVDFTDNYDGTAKEPLLLPVSFPAILANVNQGIAVGMASNIACFNLRELCAAAIAYIDDPKADIRTLMPAPDFPSGGELIYNEKAMADIFETGRGTFRMRGRYRYEKKNSCIEIYELPYTTTAEAVIDAVVDLVKKGRLKDVVDVRDETDLSGLKIAVDIKKNADPDEIAKRLFRMTPLEDSYGCNFNVLINGKPRVMGVRELLGEWLSFRSGCVRRQLAFDAARKVERLHLLEGLYGILVDIDKAIRIIRGTKNDRDVVPNLMEGFGIDRPQADFICDIRLRNLNEEYILNRAGEIDALRRDIAAIERTLQSEKRLRALIKKQLAYVAETYGKPRLTAIVGEGEVEAMGEEEFIEDYNLKLFLTEQNYIKKIPLTSLRSSGDHKLKEGDSVIQEIEASNRAELLLFTNSGEVCKIKAHDIAETKASSMGLYLSSVLNLPEGERIVYVTVAGSYDGFMLFGFANGKFAKVGMAAYATKTNRKRLANAYATQSPLAYIARHYEDGDIAIFSSRDRALVVNTAAIGMKATRNAIGIQVMKLSRGAALGRACPAESSGLEGPSRFRPRALPAAGRPAYST
ncbi:MAG: topoisomerase IV [Oscillospiraceae bacterium]|nr:topoisomerase IV [Oscillospiraceae bacterium]